MWLGDGLFGKRYFVMKEGVLVVMMWARTERDANNAMRDWVESLDAGGKWTRVDDG